MQTVIPLQGGRDGALRLTTARYYTPAGRSIQGAGHRAGHGSRVAPRRSRAEAARLQRLAISEADLPNALNNEFGAHRRAACMCRTISRRKTGTQSDDYQLRRAHGIPAPRHGCGTTARPRRLSRLTTRQSSVKRRSRSSSDGWREFSDLARHYDSPARKHARSFAAEAAARSPARDALPQTQSPHRAFAAVGVLAVWRARRRADVRRSGRCRPAPRAFAATLRAPPRTHRALSFSDAAEEGAEMHTFRPR